MDGACLRQSSEVGRERAGVEDLEIVEIIKEESEKD